MKKIIAWIIFSSNNPEKVSLTIKSVATALITLATVYAGFANVQLDSATLTRLVDLVVSFVQGAFLLVSTGMSIYGLGRKVFLTLKGKNPVIHNVVK